MTGVSLREFPYPYRCALAICSDIDGSDPERFLEYHKFLNTKKSTSLGNGLGLEIGDTFWMYSVHSETDDAFSYFDGTSTNPSKWASMIKKMVQSGYIDCLHTFGNFSQFGGFERELAINAVNRLNSEEMKVGVWINHGDCHNLQNIGGASLGDTPELVSADGTKTRAVEYHTDITIPYGIKFIWTQENTTLVGQERPYSIVEYLREDILNFRPKQILKKTGKLILHKVLAIPSPLENNLLRVVVLADGQKVYNFKRFGVWGKDHAEDLKDLISKTNLETLKLTQGYMIVYVHLGKGSFSRKVCEALRNLQRENESGNIYVTATSKLLNYYVAYKYLDWSVSIRNGIITIVLNKISDPLQGKHIPSTRELEGITFYTPNPEKTEVFIKTKRIRISKNPKDFRGKKSVTIPLIPLQFPRDL